MAEVGGLGCGIMLMVAVVAGILFAVTGSGWVLVLGVIAAIVLPVILLAGSA